MKEQKNRYEQLEDLAIQAAKEHRFQDFDRLKEDMGRLADCETDLGVCLTRHPAVYRLKDLYPFDYPNGKDRTTENISFMQSSFTQEQYQKMSEWVAKGRKNGTYDDHVGICYYHWKMVDESPLGELFLPSGKKRRVFWEPEISDWVSFTED